MCEHPSNETIIGVFPVRMETVPFEERKLTDDCLIVTKDDTHLHCSCDTCREVRGKSRGLYYEVIGYHKDDVLKSSVSHRLEIYPDLPGSLAKEYAQGYCALGYGNWLKLKQDILRKRKQDKYWPEQ